MDLSTLPITGVDMAILATALALGNAFAFGIIQLPLNKLVPSDYKSSAFIAISALSTVALYFGLLSDLLLLKVLIASVSGAYGVTGGIDFYKKDVKSEPVTVVAS